MSETNPESLLIAEMDKGLSRIAELRRYYQVFKQDVALLPKERAYDLVILADIVSDYYTCLETTFFRISQHFENCLEKERWHASLLDRMTTDVPGVRPRVIDDVTYECLRDIMKFRHFKRYYFQYDYDRERMEFLEKRFVKSLPLVESALQAFKTFVQASMAG